MVPNRKVGIYRKFQVDMSITLKVIRKNLRGASEPPPGTNRVKLDLAARLCENFADVELVVSEKSP